MVKVLREGKKREERWPYNQIFRCDACGCRFKVEPGDEWEKETINSGDPREDGDWAHHPCPNCGVRATGVPPEWVKD